MKFGEIQVRMDERMRLLFEILRPYPDGLPRDMAIERLVKAMPLSEHETGTYASGGQRIVALIAFATANFVKAGWLSKDHRMWRAKLNDTARRRLPLQPVWWLAVGETNGTAPPLADTGSCG